MILKQKNDISYYQLPNLARFPDIWHGIFTRNDEYGSDPYQRLNISLGLTENIHDDKKERLTDSDGAGKKELVFLKQVHGTKIRIYIEESIHMNASALEGDAMVSNIQHKFLVILVADCQAVLLYDPIRRVVANIHSGWRGSIANLIGRTIHVMEEHFLCNGSDIIAGIGPSLGPCCAEFINYRQEIPKIFWKYKDRTDHFDFWSLSRDQLRNAGLLTDNIEISGICTKCNADRFYSYRGEDTASRFPVVIGLI